MGHIYVDAGIGGRNKGLSVRMFVDTGSTFSLISESLARDIGAIFVDEKQQVELFDGRLQEYPVAIASIELLGRKAVGQAFLVGNNGEAVLGVLALEALGVAVDPTTGEVRPSRGWQARGPFQARPKS
ncbi:MAG: aspartyl protease family protein [Chloroflexi bacterium]|nr:aspartyl protease family protein [Chloroflexota bacterium]